MFGLRDLSDEIAADANALLHDKECVRVNLVYRFLQVCCLEFRHADAEHANVAAGVGSLALPVGQAAANAGHDALRQRGVSVLGEDKHLHVDVLLMSAVDKQRAEHRVDDRIDGRAQVEEERAGNVEHDVKAQRKAPDGEAAAALGQAQTDNVQSAGRAAAGKGETKGEAAENAADKARGERIFQNRHGGGAYHAQEERRRAHTDQRAQQKTAAEVAPGEIQHRNIDEKVQNTGDVHARGQIKMLHEQCTNDLAETDHTAGIKPHRHDEKVYAQRVEKRCKNRDQDAHPFVLQCFVQHDLSSSFLSHRPLLMCRRGFQFQILSILL